MCNLFIEIELIMFGKLYLLLKCFLLLFIIRRCSAVFSGFTAGTHTFFMQAVKCTGSKEGRQCGGFTTNSNATNSFIYTFRTDPSGFFLYAYSPITEILPPRCFVNTFTSP